jgi:hypothetical protein
LRLQRKCSPKTTAQLRGSKDPLMMPSAVAAAMVYLAAAVSNSRIENSKMAPREFRALKRQCANRQAPRSPDARMRLEDACTSLPALHASSVGRHCPRRDVIPVAADQTFAAVMTIGALSSLVAHIACVDVMKPAFQRDLPCCPKRRRGRWRHTCMRQSGWKAETDASLFGSQLGHASWHPWRALLLAICGEPLYLCCCELVQL